MERQSDDTNRVSEIRRVPYRTTTKLGRDYKVDRRGSEEYEKTIQQEKRESIRIEDQRQYVVRKQKYLFESTFKEARPEKIQTF